jgi:hypothetical protein
MMGAVLHPLFDVGVLGFVGALNTNITVCTCLIPLAYKSERDYLFIW